MGCENERGRDGKGQKKIIGKNSPGYTRIAAFKNFPKI